MHEARLVMEDGEGMRAAAAALAEELGAPVWVTSRGAAALASNDGRMQAWRQGGPASWVQVLPGDRPAVDTGFHPWYRTDYGMIQPRSGESIIRHVGADGADAILLASHRAHNAVRAGSVLLPRAPAGLYTVSADVVPGEGGPEFLLPDYDGSVARHPLGELPRLLDRYGWTVGRAILISSDFSGYAGESANRDWEALTAGLARLAEAARASVFFPGRGSRAERPGWRVGSVVSGGEDPRWWRADPPRGLGEPARPALVQDPAGRLWSSGPAPGSRTCRRARASRCGRGMPR